MAQLVVTGAANFTGIVLANGGDLQGRALAADALGQGRNDLTLNVAIHDGRTGILVDAIGRGRRIGLFDAFLMIGLASSVQRHGFRQRVRSQLFGRFWRLPRASPPVSLLGPASAQGRASSGDPPSVFPRRAFPRVSALPAPAARGLSCGIGGTTGKGTAGGLGRTTFVRCPRLCRASASSAELIRIVLAIQAVRDRRTNVEQRDCRENRVITGSTPVELRS